MTLDTRCKWTAIAFTALVGAALAWRLGLTFPLRDLLEPCAIVGGLGLVAAYYRRRRCEPFVATTITLMQFVAYSTCFTTVMYAVAAIGGPLFDSTCQEIDAVCGVSLPAIVDWIMLHPTIRVALIWAYNTMLPQTALVIALLGLSGRVGELQRFLRQFMIGSAIVLICFAFIPAAGPFRAYGYEPAPDQARYLQHFDQLRSGERTIITWRDAEGLITFPSFHTVWALLLVIAVRHNRWLRGPLLLLNLAVILATMTTGWHYFADVLSGLGTTAAAIVLNAVFEAYAFCDLATSRKQVSLVPQPELIPPPCVVGTAG